MKIGGYRIRLKSCSDLFVPILFTSVLIYYMVNGRHIMNTDAMLMPKLLTAIMALSLVFIIRGALVITKAGEDFPEEKKRFFSTKEDYIKSVGFGFLAILYISSITFIGFTISTLVFLALTMFFLGVRKISTLIFTPFFITALICVLFRMLLKISLPIGIWGI